MCVIIITIIIVWKASAKPPCGRRPPRFFYISLFLSFSIPPRNHCGRFQFPAESFIERKKVSFLIDLGCSFPQGWKLLSFSYSLFNSVSSCLRSRTDFLIFYWKDRKLFTEREREREPVSILFPFPPLSSLKDSCFRCLRAVNGRERVAD